MSAIFAFALGLGTVNNKGELLEVLFPEPLHDLSTSEANTVQQALSSASISMPQSSKLVHDISTEQATQIQSILGSDLLTNSFDWGFKPAKTKKLVVVVLQEDSAPESVAEAYLKLQLLSHRKVKPHDINLDGIFTSLPNVAWTNKGPVDLEELPSALLAARASGEWLDVKSVDKFPAMCDYIVPTGTRIADTARVRLGAYVGAGTTIMHEGFINFNAGTAGTSMIEGRISAGVFIDEGTDLGGGCSTMGTLSGGGNVIISVGKNCLIGANAGIGIALGDRCIVEAGLYITAGTKVALLDDKNTTVDTIKARELSGKSDLLFRRNSQTGAVECKTNKTTVELNAILHSNN